METCPDCEVYRLPNGIVLVEEKAYYITRTPLPFSKMELQYEAYMLKDFWTPKTLFLPESSMVDKNVRGRYTETERLKFALNDTTIDLKYATHTKKANANANANAKKKNTAATWGLIRD